jgi:hypothetical protein
MVFLRVWWEETERINRTTKQDSAQLHLGVESAFIKQPALCVLRLSGHSSMYLSPL